MERKLNIAVSGVSIIILNQLKIQIISCLPPDIEIQWVNISEKHIDLLLINKIFFNSSSIQNILSYNVSHYLCLSNVADHGGKIIDDTLFYPILHLEEFKKWMYDHFLDNSIPKQPKVITESNSTLKNFDTVSIFDSIFNSNNGFIRIDDTNYFLFLIDTTTERIFVNSEIPILRLSNTIRLSYANPQFVQETIRKYQRIEDLYIGLWKILNHSIILNMQQVQSDQYFKLYIWPQVSVDSERRDLFKLSACFSEGANIQMVVDHLKLPYQQVLQFIARAQLLRMGQFIQPNEAKFIGCNQAIEEVKVNKIQSFFGKLRKRLGI